MQNLHFVVQDFTKRMFRVTLEVGSALIVLLLVFSL